MTKGCLERLKRKRVEANKCTIPEVTMKVWDTIHHNYPEERVLITQVGQQGDGCKNTNVGDED